MNVQMVPSVTENEAWEALNAKFGEHFVIPSACYFEYWAYPQVFGSTAGPFKGKIAGQAMTTFTIEAWAVDDLAVLFCQGKIVKVCNEWQGPQSVRI